MCICFYLCQLLMFGTLPLPNLFVSLFDHRALYQNGQQTCYLSHSIEQLCTKVYVLMVKYASGIIALFGIDLCATVKCSNFYCLVLPYNLCPRSFSLFCIFIFNLKTGMKNAYGKEVQQLCTNRVFLINNVIYDIYLFIIQIAVCVYRSHLNGFSMRKIVLFCIYFLY